MICGGGKEEPVLKKLSVCVLFGGVSSEHEVSLRSAESVLNRLDKDKYHIFPVGITKDGDWILFGGKDYGMLPAGTWQNCEENRRAALSPVRGQGLLSFENDCVVRERIDVVFPVMHGENCEDGAIQGLLQIAGIPYVGPHVAASAACMDKTITKLIADAAGVRQAAWQLVTREGFARSREAALSAVEARFAYPVFVVLGGLALRERVQKKALFCAVLCSLGILLLIAPSGAVDPLGVALALTSGVTYAVYILLLAHFRLQEGMGFRMTFYMALISAVCMFFLCLFSHQLCLPQTLAGWLAALAFSLTICIGAVMLFQMGTFLIGAQRDLFIALSLRHGRRGGADGGGQRVLTGHRITSGQFMHRAQK